MNTQINPGTEALVFPYGIPFFLKFIFGCCGSSLLSWFSLLCWVGATLRCRAQASHCGSFSCCRAQALGCLGSVVMTHRLSCSTGHRIFQGQEWNPSPSHWQADSYLLYHQVSLWDSFICWCGHHFQWCLTHFCQIYKSLYVFLSPYWVWLHL